MKYKINISSRFSINYEASTLEIMESQEDTDNGYGPLTNDCMYFPARNIPVQKELT